MTERFSQSEMACDSKTIEGTAKAANEEIRKLGN